MELKEKIVYLKEKLPKSKSGFLIAVGIVGLLLILISSFDFTNAETDKKAQPTEVVTADASLQYAESVEKKLEALISDMLGKTSVEVMVTLESGKEYVYADEIMTDADITRDQSALKTQQSDKNQKSYIVIKDADGNEKPLVITEKMPTVRGVVVVCESGETPAVASAVRLAVKSALNVDEDKICVIGRY